MQSTEKVALYNRLGMPLGDLEQRSVLEVATEGTQATVQALLSV